MSSVIEQFEEFKNTDEYSEYLKGLKNDFPELFTSQIELSIFTWFNETVYKQYCEDNNLEFKSLLNEAQNIVIEKPLGGTTKAVKSYSKEDWEKEFAYLEPVKGTVSLIKEDDTEFKLPDLTEED
jgi:hypothetical protein